MTVARTWSVALLGVEGALVEVEADLSNQTPELKIIGLADKALGEAARRVHNACANSGLSLPRRRLTINLSPASLPKQGSGFDVAIAIASLATEVADGCRVPRVDRPPGRARARRPAEAGPRHPSRCRRGGPRGHHPRRRAAGEHRRGRAGRGCDRARRRQPRRGRALARGPRRCDRPGSDPASRHGDGAPSDPGSRRSHRSARGRRCARRGSGGRSSPPDVRTAGCGQDDARAAPSRHPPSARRTRRADGSHDPLARRRARDDPHPHAAVRGSAPLGERGGPGGRRIPGGATGRDRPCQRGSPVPRRGGRVPVERAGCPPSAAGERSHRDPPRGRHRLVPGTVPAGARDQPVSVRRLRRQGRLLHLPADGDPPLPRETLRTASRPHRHRALAGPGRRRARGDGRRRDGHHGDRTRAGAPGARADPRHGSPVRRGASTPRCRAPGCARDRSRPPPRCAACSMRRCTAEP